MSNFPFQRVLVTGGAGFLGVEVVEKLRARGVAKIYSLNRTKDWIIDLKDVQDVDRFFWDDTWTAETLIIHCAANCGGIGKNQQSPGALFYDNAFMGLNLMETARRYGVKKFISIGTICSYPENTPVPFKEEDLWNGYPEPTNAAYGMAKKMLIVQSQAYRQQYGFNSINLLLANLYGPRDNFDPETSHVIPAIIRKCVEAVETGAESIRLWGTGQPTREFLHVEDAADAILLAAERYDSSEPVNVGTGWDIKISNLAVEIAEATGFYGTIEFDIGKPDGQLRRCLDVSKAKERFGFTAKKDFYQGLRETIDWYKANRGKAAAA